MKKLACLSLIFVTIFILIFTLASYGQGIPKIGSVVVGSGSIGGAFNLIAATICDEANLITGQSAYGSISGGGITNVPMVSKGDAGIGMSYTPHLKLAEKGEFPYDQKITNVRALFKVIPGVYHLIADPNLPISSFEELVKTDKTFRLGFSTPAAGDFVILSAILNYYGSSVRALDAKGNEVLQQSFNENVDSWKDRRLDLFATLIMTPASSITDAISSRRGVIWSFPDDLIEHLEKEYGCERFTIRAGTYGLEKDVISVDVPIVFFARENLPEETAYYFTKAAAEGHERLISVLSGFKDWSPETMFEGVGIDLHPGAEKYYKERGWLK